MSIGTVQCSGLLVWKILQVMHRDLQKTLQCFQWPNSLEKNKTRTLLLKKKSNTQSLQDPQKLLLLSIMSTKK